MRESPTEDWQGLFYPLRISLIFFLLIPIRGGIFKIFFQQKKTDDDESNIEEKKISSGFHWIIDRDDERKKKEFEEWK